MPICCARTPGADEVCVGILILVPEPLAGQVSELRATLTPEWEDATPSHVTLVPPTLLRRDDLPTLVGHLEDVARRHGVFDIHLLGTGTFRPVTEVAYLRVAEGREACAALQGDLCSGPVPMRLRYRYHPHVTLAHDVPPEALDRAEAAMAGVDERFTVGRFVLFVDDRGRGWESAEEFVLTG